MDILSDILTHLNLSTSLYFRTDLVAPWGVRVPEYQNVARFHLAITGSFYLQVEGESEFLVGPGDIVLVPHGRSHTLKSQPDSEVLELDQVLQEGHHDPENSWVLERGPGPVPSWSVATSALKTEAFIRSPKPCLMSCMWRGQRAAIRAG